jgi:hypothetical protein
MMILNQSGKLKRKPSGGERAWFLEEESEPRNKLRFLAGETQRADVLASLTVAFSRLWRWFRLLPVLIKVDPPLILCILKNEIRSTPRLN